MAATALDWWCSRVHAKLTKISNPVTTSPLLMEFLAYGYKTKTILQWKKLMPSKYFFLEAIFHSPTETC